MPVDHLATALEIKQVSDQRIISGHAAAWSLDRVGDVIDPTAFTKTLSEKAPSDVAVFIGHDQSTLPVGVPLVIRPDSKGLYTEVRVFDGPAGDNLLAVARGLKAHGQTLGLSIGYRVRDSQMERTGSKMQRRLLDIDLVEFSYAARQSIANPAALMTGVKQVTEYSRDELQAALTAMDTDAQTTLEAGASESKAEVLPMDLNALPDSAFLYIGPGGQRDDDGKTVPRSLRGFPYRDAEGKISAELLRGAPRDIAASAVLDAESKTVLGARARLMLDTVLLGKTAEVFEVSEWKAGAAIQVRAIGDALDDIAETIAAEHKAMALLGTDTKGNGRLRSDVRERLTALAGDITRMVRHAELIDAEQDGAAQVALNRSRLQLLEV